MTTTEYLLLAMVILVPLAIAVIVTLWSLKQASLRNRKNRQPPKPAGASETAAVKPEEPV